MTVPMALRADLDVFDQNNFLSKFFEISKKEFGEESFTQWISKLEISAISESEVIFCAPSKFLRDWIIREFIEKKSAAVNLQSVVKQILPKVRKIAVIHLQNSASINFSNSQNSVESAPSENKILNLSKHGNVFAFGCDLNPKFTFDNFVSAKYNKLALTMARIAAGVDAQISLFDDKLPLFIHGGIGMGKTHLAQAIAWSIKENNKSKKVVYLSAEKFMFHFVQSVRSNDLMSFKEKIHSIDVLIVDDMQFIAGKEATQKEFMNSFNHMIEQNKQVILVCDQCPSDLENIDEKLKSRISGGMIINFKKPNYEDRAEIVRKKANLMNFEISDELVNFIAEKITTNIRDIEGALKKLAAEKFLLNEEINVESARSTLSAYIKSSSEKVITIQKIQQNVSQFYNLKLSDLTSQNRLRQIARPRQVAMYMAKNLTSNSLLQIGKEFNKDHATVIYAIKSVEKMMTQDEKFAQEVRNLMSA